MSDCIFCKIAKGELPAVKVYEDEKFLAFLDLHPVSVGHTLVVPKDHFVNILDTPEEVLSGLMAVVKKISPAILKVANVPSFNLGVNNGVAAGQIIEHTHFHIIPRLADDGLRNWPSRQGYEPGVMEKVGEEIKKQIK